MTTTPSSADLLNRLTAVRRLCPEIRLGQLVAIIGQLAEDETGRNLWEIEDEEFAVAIERFATDLSLRQQGASKPVVGPVLPHETAVGSPSVKRS